MTKTPSIAHGQEWKWRQPQPPKKDSDSPVITARPFETCSYCGSMSPACLAAAIEAGARLELADQKYGWPHKWYVHNAPNPFVGMVEVRSYKSEPNEDGSRTITPGPEETIKATTDYGKFYTIHLKDATDAEKAIIARGMGYWITFTDDGRLLTERWVPPATESIPAVITGQTVTVDL